MNKKILAVTIASIFLLSACVGLAQIKPVSAITSYRIEIKVTKMNLYDDGDGAINGFDRGELYMLERDSDWPVSDSSKYWGGYSNIGSVYLPIMAVSSYDISGEGVSHSTLRSYTTYDYTYCLNDKDFFNSDDKLWYGKVSITGTTAGWVSGWSGAEDSTVSLGYGVSIITWDTLSGTHQFSTTGPGTVATWYQTFTNALYFQVRVTATNLV